MGAERRGKGGVRSANDVVWVGDGDRSVKEFEGCTVRLHIPVHAADICLLSNIEQFEYSENFLVEFNQILQDICSMYAEA